MLNLATFHATFHPILKKKKKNLIQIQIQILKIH